MKKIFLLPLFFLILSCDGVTEADLAKINGYWEIETATMPDGAEKEYTINTTIDYFEMKGKAGFRKKVMPQFDGTYRTGDNSEKIAVVEADGKMYLDYTTEHAKWREEIVKLNDEQLVLKNSQHLEYKYKRPQPFSVK